MYARDTIAKLIECGDAHDPALGAPGRQALSYEALRALIERTARALNAIGIGLGDRVAIVLPNGPEMASAFLTVGSVATAAPLNPAYRQGEFDFYLSDLNAKALVILEGMDSPARAVASARGIPIIEVEVDPAKRRRRVFSEASRLGGDSTATIRPCAGPTTSRWFFIRPAPRRGPRSSRSLIAMLRRRRLTSAGRCACRARTCV